MHLTDRRAVPEASGTPERLAFKTADTATSGQMLALDDAEGIVTAIVSVTGTEDEVADIIVPGAYSETLTKRRPKVCWAHSWEHPIGRVLHIEELMPGDDRLPTMTKDGTPWPREAGALVATMQFNMRTTEGKNAFEAVRFYSETGECEYSIGYQVPAGKSTRDRAGVRHIKSLDLYELSVVLFGAHTQTGTLSIKQALAQITERKSQRGTTGSVRTEQQRRTAKDALARIAQQAKATPPPTVPGTEAPPASPAVPKAAVEETPKDAPDFSDGVMVALYPDPAAADKIAQQISGPDKTLDKSDLHVTLAYLGKVGELSLSMDEVVKRVTEAVQGERQLSGTIGGIGMFPADDEDEGAPTWAPVDVVGLTMLRETVVDALGDVVATDHGFTPHMTLGYDLGVIDPLPPVPVTFDAVHVVYGDQDRTITLSGGSAEEDDAAEFKGLSLSEVVRRTAIASLREIKAEGGADRNRGDAEKLRRYWTTGEGGAKIAWDTPGDFTRCVGFLSEHMTPERAKGYCANRHKEMTGMWPGDKDNKATGYDPGLDADPITTETKVGVTALGAAKGYPRLPGSFEERQDALSAAVQEALRGDLVNEEDRRYEWDHVSIDATYDDRVIATRHRWSDDTSETYEMGYRFDGDTVQIGGLDRVELQVVAVDADGAETADFTLADVMPLAENVATVAHAFKAAQAAMEGKAGRVLSGKNERALRDAVEHLVSVLAAAGVKITVTEAAEEPDDDDKPGKRGDERSIIDPGIDLSTTSPSASVKAREDGTFVLEAKDLDAVLGSLSLD